MWSKLLHLLPVHIISKMAAQDVQALCHTCTAIRQLISSQLPVSTWVSIAVNTFPPGHCVRAADASQIPKLLDQLAGLRAALEIHELEAAIKGYGKGKAAIATSSTDQPLLLTTATTLP